MATLTRPAPRAVITVGDALRWRPLIAFFATFILATMAVAIVAAVYAALHVGSIFPGVTVGGFAVGGLDRAAAEAALRRELPTLSAGSLIVRVDGVDHAVAFSDVGRDYAIAAMLDRAFAVGRQGNPLEQAGSQLRTLASGVDVAPEATWDEQRLIGAIDAIATAAAVKPVDATVVRQADGYAATPAVDGHRLDIARLRGLAVHAINTTVPGNATVALQTERIAPHVATAVAQAAVDSFNATTTDPVAVTGGGLTLSVDPAVLRNWVELVPGQSPGGGWSLSVNENAIWAWIAPLGPQVNREPAEASLTLTETGVEAVAGVTGQLLDVKSSVERMTQLIQARAGGTAQPSMQLAVATTEPHFTTAAATDFASKVQMVSSWTTRYIPGPSNFFGKNIQIPARLLNGTVVGPGERFSFLDAVGPITPNRGFGLGGAIIRGHTQEQGAMGGGICSASTTLFNAALRYGYDIVDRTQHAYYINRYPVGLDATVFRSDFGGHDMAFVNDSQYPLWIRGINSRNKITFQIWTIPDGRTVKISKPQVTNRQQAEDTTEYVDNLDPGVEERVEYPVDGFDASVRVVVYDASGAVLHNDTYTSHYITVTGVTQIGISPTAPPPTEPPPPPPPPAP